MIRSIDYDLAPIRPGETRPLSVDADGELEIVLWCYRDPPGVVTQCGRIRVRPRAVVDIGPDVNHFPAGTSGEFTIEVTDTDDGSQEKVTVSVLAKTATGTPVASPAASREA